MGNFNVSATRHHRRAGALIDGISRIRKTFEGRGLATEGRNLNARSSSAQRLVQIPGGGMG